MSENAPASGFQPPRPGAEHEVLGKDVGTWEATVEIRIGPGAPPQVSRGVAHNRLACGGLWLVSDFRNETTGFEGHGIRGFDPKRGKYVGTWVDPMRTFLAIGEGSWDAAARTMTMWVETPAGEGKPPVRWREVTETRDPDTRVFRSFLPLPGGGEHEMMTVTYVRRSGG